MEGITEVYSSVLSYLSSLVVVGLGALPFLSTASPSRSCYYILHDKRRELALQHTLPFFLGGTLTIRGTAVESAAKETAASKPYRGLDVSTAGLGQETEAASVCRGCVSLRIRTVIPAGSLLRSRQVGSSHGNAFGETNRFGRGKRMIPFLPPPSSSQADAWWQPNKSDAVRIDGLRDMQYNPSGEIRGFLVGPLHPTGGMQCLVVHT